MNIDRLSKLLRERESVILFVSHDKLLPEDIPHLEKLGRFVARHFLYCIVETGNDTRADARFFLDFMFEAYGWNLREEMHVVDPMYRLIFPVPDYNLRAVEGCLELNPAHRRIFTLDQHRLTEKMPFVDGAKKHFPEYADEISTYVRTGHTGGDPEVINKLRYTLMIMGEYEFNIYAPDVVLIYNDLKNPREGRVDDIISLCEHFNIPFADQTIWKKWLRDWKEK
ncbi:MAG: hypothetical protein ACLFUB_16195 [Cyclobacteriaceae bacterium]